MREELELTCPCRFWPMPLRIESSIAGEEEGPQASEAPIEWEGTMRKVRVFESISIDGYFTDASGDISWAHAGREGASPVRTTLRELVLLELKVAGPRFESSSRAALRRRRPCIRSRVQGLVAVPLFSRRFCRWRGDPVRIPAGLKQ